jgi:hypothetical protein
MSPNDFSVGEASGHQPAIGCGPASHGLPLPRPIGRYGYALFCGLSDLLLRSARTL